MIFYLNLQISLIMCSALITYEIGGRYEIIFYLICFLHKEIHTIAEIMGGKNVLELPRTVTFLNIRKIVAII